MLDVEVEVLCRLKDTTSVLNYWYDIQEREVFVHKNEGNLQNLSLQFQTIDSVNKYDEK